MNTAENEDSMGRPKKPGSVTTNAASEDQPGKAFWEPGIGQGRSSVSPMYVSRPDPVQGVPGGGKLSGASSTTVSNFSPLDTDYRVRGVDRPAFSQEPRLVPGAPADAKPAPNPDNSTDSGGPARVDGLADVLRRMQPGDSIEIDATKSRRKR
jgi:hypothetical protein